MARFLLPALIAAALAASPAFAHETVSSPGCADTEETGAVAAAAASGGGISGGDVAAATGGTEAAATGGTVAAATGGTDAAAVPAVAAQAPSPEEPGGEQPGTPGGEEQPTTPGEPLPPLPEPPAQPVGGGEEGGGGLPRTGLDALRIAALGLLLLLVGARLRARGHREREPRGPSGSLPHPDWQFPGAAH